jgi:hypothetical protein
MFPIHTVFGSLMILFGLIGSLRGWAKEIIVAFSVILALFVEHVLLLVNPLRVLFENMSLESRFYTRAVVFILVTVFGYASPAIAKKLGGKLARDRLQDILLGFFIGLLNGFLVIGTLFSFLNSVHYGVPEEMRVEQPVFDETGQQVFDEDGNAVTETVYYPEAEGIGGITPPKPDDTAAKLIAFLPPEIITQSNTLLYLAVAASFVFVIIVFI